MHVTYARFTQGNLTPLGGWRYRVSYCIRCLLLQQLTHSLV